MSLSYLTLSDDIVHEIEPIKGSRFITYSFVVESHAAVINMLNKVKQEHPNAKHHCWAYQLHDGITIRSSDDGEPAGSAGKPILAPLLGREIFDVLIVVVRYFGGVKLGVGGLVRAYSQCANAVIEHANIITITPTVALGVRFDYEETNAINTLIRQHGLSVSASNYGNQVTLWFDIEAHKSEATKALFISFTADKVDFISTLK